MLKSVLVHLSGCSGNDRAIEIAAAIAQGANARLHGLSALNAPESSSTEHIVSAAHMLAESGKRAHLELRQSFSHEHLLEIGARFEIEVTSRGTDGDTIESLVREAQYHDLLVTCCPTQGQSLPYELTAWQHLELTARSRLPHFISRGIEGPPRRVLLVYDRSDASARAIRTFLAQNPLPGARCRLLGIGAAANQKSLAFCSMRDYCQTQRDDLEIGCLPGSPRRVLIPYAEKWEADALVLGIPSNLGFWSRLTGAIPLDILQRTQHDLYLVG
ncbi:universal stress protein [Blastopirellula marina]|uniref:Universal stress protein n=1 Tax=Blastopirellula marina TaxID=124 RepID=A0A2S8G1R1_9BACT|nr:universal stress protein [Blastopirellula marina]PQO38382.1 hypothetical protein C5Y98_09980 [Blastopirellula marina]PTL45039.1 universal stress protein [Blastopirellula marina]